LAETNKNIIFAIALKRLQKEGYVIYRYELEGPFFKEWIIASNN
jgi:hypothetical protein